MDEFASLDRRPGSRLQPDRFMDQIERGHRMMRQRAERQLAG